MSGPGRLRPRWPTLVLSLAALTVAARKQIIVLDDCDAAGGYYQSFQGRWLPCGSFFDELQARYGGTFDVFTLAGADLAAHLAAEGDYVQLVLAPGRYSYLDLYFASTDYLQPWFVVIDCPPNLPSRLGAYSNFVCMSFDVSQTGYAAGYLAGLVSSSKVVGFVASNSDQVWQQLRGFQLGVKASCPDCLFTGQYVMSDLESHIAAEYAQWLVLDAGADVVFGVGAPDIMDWALDAAAGLGAYIIAADEDPMWWMSGIGYEHLLLTSTQTHLAAALLDAADRFATTPMGNPVRGLQRGLITLRYADGFLSLGDCYYSCLDFGNSTWPQVRDVEAQLEDGVIVVDVGFVEGGEPLEPQEKNVFELLEPAYLAPPPRAGHTAGYFGIVLWKVSLFGGVDANGTILGDAWMFDIPHGIWHKLEYPFIIGTPPPPLAHACSVWVGQQLAIFGGTTAGGNVSDQFYILQDTPYPDDPSTDSRYSWLPALALGQPPPLAGHACVSYTELCGAVYGGRTPSEESGDLSLFCVSTDGTVDWQPLFDGEAARRLAGDNETGNGTGLPAFDGFPAARSNAGLGKVSARLLNLTSARDVLVMAGGISEGVLLRDAWVFELDARRWIRLPDLPMGLEQPTITEEWAAMAGEAFSGYQYVLLVQSTSWRGTQGFVGFALDASMSEWYATAVGTNDPAMEGVQGAAAARIWYFNYLVGGSKDGAPQDVDVYSSQYEFKMRCNRGFFAEGVRCRACPVGKTSQAGERSECTDCDAGKFAALTGQSECGTCPVGRFSPEGAAACLDCVAGSSTNQAFGQDHCPLCPEGEFSGPGAAECQRCPIGRFADERGTSECEVCEGDLTTRYPAAKVESRCICPQGTYLPLSSNSSCLPCPEGMTCPLGSAEAALDPSNEVSEDTVAPLVDAGFMTLAQEPFKVYACAEDEFCPGGPPASCAKFRDVTTVGCGDCVPNAFAAEGEGECRYCDGGARTHAIVLFVLVVLAAALATIVVAVVANLDVAAQKINRTSFVACVGLTISMIQSLSLFSELQVRWVSPMGAILRILSFTTFDTKVFRLGCIVNEDPMTSFLFSHVPIFFCALLVLVTLIVKQQVLRKQISRLGVEMINTMGTIVSITFLPILLQCLKPFICYEHPYGGASMKSNPSVLCFDSDIHERMAVIGIIAFVLVPLPFLAVSCYGTYKYSVVMSTFDAERSAAFFRAMKFLFLKYHPSRFFYGIIHLMRSTLICLVPVMFRGDGPTQVIIVIFVVLSFLHLQLTLQPWHRKFTNAFDGVLSISLVLVLTVAAISTGGAAKDEWLGYVGLVVLIILFILTLISLVRMLLVYLRVSPWYDHFITHHKAHAAAQARYLKMTIESRYRQRVFIDSDDLKDLTLLFSTVAGHIGQLIAYLTRDTLTRPWCVGEVVTAFKAQVRVVAVHTPQFYMPSDMEMDNLNSYIDMSSCTLAHFNMTDRDMRNTLIRLLSDRTPTIEADPTTPLALRIHDMLPTLCKGKPLSNIESVKSGRSLRFASKEGLSSKRKTAGMLLVSADPTDEEACAAAGILVAKLQIGLLHLEAAGCHSLCETAWAETDVGEVSDLLARARAVLVLLSGRSLTSEVQLFAVVEALWKHDARVTPQVIPVALPSFRFPSAEELEKQLPKAMYQEPGIGADQVRELFNIIASPFSIMASDDILSAQTRAVLARLPQIFDSAEVANRRGPFGSGCEVHVPKGALKFYSGGQEENDEINQLLQASQHLQPAVRSVDAELVTHGSCETTQV